MSTGSKTSGAMLSVTDIDQMAVRIAEMHTRFNTDRRSALLTSEEVREYLFATDIDSTSAAQLPHKNRTHQPKLTQISDNLQSQYWDAALATNDFFKYDGITEEDKEKALKIEAWVRMKLEQRKFRQTTGRALLADYVAYGNCFASVDFVVETDDFGREVYKGPDIRRVSPMDITFNPRARSFAKSPKIDRQLIHIADLASLPDKFPGAGFSQAKIDKVVSVRSETYLNDWVDSIKDRGLLVDGFGSTDAYYKQDMVELLVYKGDVFDPQTNEHQKNRVVYIVDRLFVIRNEPSKAPRGFDGLHHAGWRIRNDNLWSQGPLDNLLGMQYRIDHLENLGADIFDLIAHPVLVVKGESVSEPESGYAPGAVYYAGVDEDVAMLVPDPTSLRSDSKIELYHRLMEQFAGAPPETAGIRTPGEKTAFEVNKLDANATKLFVDKTRSFEVMIEGCLQEAFGLMLLNFADDDYVAIFNDISGAEELEQIALEDVFARGAFKTMGSQHWSKRNRETAEMLQFQQGPMQDPKVRAHVNGEKLATYYETRLGLQDAEIIEPFAGVKEDVTIQMVARAEQQRIQQEAEVEPTAEELEAGGSKDPTSTDPLQPQAGSAEANPLATEG